MAGKRDWVDVDMDGLRKVLERRGKELAIYELVQNGWDENVTKVEVTLTRPDNGRSELVVADDSPEGFRDLTDSYTMFAESYKKADPEKRGAFNLGEKYVLALCDEAAITTTTGRVTFDENGRRRSGNVKREPVVHFNTLHDVAVGFQQVQPVLAPLELRQIHFDLCAGKPPPPTANADHSVCVFHCNAALPI
jgi:hypothetical protein